MFDSLRSTIRMFKTSFYSTNVNYTTLAEEIKIYSNERHLLNDFEKISQDIKIAYNKLEDL